MTSPGKLNLTIRAGEDFSLVFQIEIDGSILDLTGASIYSTIRKHKHRLEDDKIVDFTVLLDGVATPNAAPTDNEIELSLTDVQTAAITDPSGWYDVLVVDSSGNDTYYLEGEVSFANTVTVKP